MIYLAEAFNKIPMVAGLTDNQEWLYIVMTSFQKNAEMRLPDMLKQKMELQLFQEEKNKKYWQNFPFKAKHLLSDRPGVAWTFSQRAFSMTI